jgi:hypothetical protein
MVPGAVCTPLFLFVTYKRAQNASVTLHIAESPANNKHSRLLAHFVRYGKKFCEYGP